MQHKSLIKLGASLFISNEAKKISAGGFHELSEEIFITNHTLSNLLIIVINMKSV